MLTLENKNNKIKLSLRMVSFEGTPEGNPENYHLKPENWIILEVELKQGNNIFIKSNACLTFGDIGSIYYWFKSISLQQIPNETNLDFLEQVISFHLLGESFDRIYISIRLEDILEPGFKVKQFHPDTYINYGNCTFEQLLEYNYDPYMHGNDILFDLGEVDFEQVLASLKKAMESPPPIPSPEDDLDFSTEDFLRLLDVIDGEPN